MINPQKEFRVLYKDLARTVTIDDTPTTIAVGETVWYFGAAQVNDVPVPAQLMRFGEDNMVDLIVHDPTTGKPKVENGICMATDPRLENMVHRKRGAWSPRGMWSFLGLKN